ncbi:hypothetical protein LSTR_LSTR002870 [Laodelphax striatellus]|uniref:Dipeptidylpeptidase IV N-terminal domain-containing protein n=1 Tax=Laodelphax striatellus TaxID=195883 RepID=A0A482XVU3_LAOST|nr:hypothetical protein LSTR_LSTR002870 [Laodelphax striatellus]
MMTLDVATKERTTFGDGDYLIPYNGVWDIVNIAIDQRWITIPHDCVNVYIYSTMCNCSIIDLATRQEYLVAGGNYTQLVRFAPITNAVVYVQENDLYYLEKPDSPNPIRLTTTGKPGIVFNGVCDFAYEDNIYMKMRAFYFSTDGTKLVYLSLNDADLKVVHYSEYGLPGDPTVYQYVKDKTIRYPKVGTPIPKASVHVICLKTKKEIIIDGLKAPAELQSDRKVPPAIIDT